jgi:hypothetical protein
MLRWYLLSFIKTLSVSMKERIIPMLSSFYLPLRYQNITANVAEWLDRHAK